MSAVRGELYFISSEDTGGPVQSYDLRTPSQRGDRPPQTSLEIADAHSASNLGLHDSGFELVHAPTKVKDFYDHHDVMATYYDECKQLAAELTGAHTTFTYDHIIRESEAQLSAGGIDGNQYRTGTQGGGGYINSVHMDYTDNTTWDRYLAKHGEVAPTADRVYALNFWRPISDSVDDNPLAVCDARTVRPDDLQEVVVYGYGAANYSWHEIGIETFSVAHSEQQAWYYYPGMTPDDVLIIKSYDSSGVIGTTCPHGSFAHPSPTGIARKSIELRVLCFC